uniref:Uncharacterized protein n=1 Tax=Photinus pyralis TaxID=7054 RepID=A0A1Y1LWS5_PHOPY
MKDFGLCKRNQPTKQKYSLYYKNYTTTTEEMLCRKNFSKEKILILEPGRCSILIRALKLRFSDSVSEINKVNKNIRCITKITPQQQRKYYVERTFVKKKF